MLPGLLDHWLFASTGQIGARLTIEHMPPSPRAQRTQFSLTFEAQLGRRFTDGSEAHHVAHSFRHGMLLGSGAGASRRAKWCNRISRRRELPDRSCTDADHGRRQKDITPGGESLMESIGLSGEIQPTLSEFEKQELALCQQLAKVSASAAVAMGGGRSRLTEVRSPHEI